MQEIDAIAAAEKQARAICEQAKAQAAEQTVQAEKDGLRSSSCAQPDCRRTRRQRHSERNWTGRPRSSAMRLNRRQSSMRTRLRQ